MKVLSGLTSPTARLAGGSLVARLAVLAVVVVGARALEREQFEVLAYLVAVTAAAQTLLDPGTINYLIKTWPTLAAQEVRPTWLVGLRLQVCVGVGTVALTTLVIGLARPEPWALGLAVALGSLSAAESVARSARAPWQAAERFSAVAAVDGCIAAGRLITAGALLAADGTAVFCAANGAVALMLLAVPLVVVRTLPPPGGEVVPLRRLVMQVWPYSTFWPSLYAQAPAVLIGIVGSVREAAVYAIATRITQPTELLPLSVSNAYLPRLVRATDDGRMIVFWAQVRLALTLAIAATAALVVLSPLLLALFDIPFSTGGPVLIVLAVALVPKYLNYQLVSLAIARGEIRRRFRISALVAALSICAVLALASTGALTVALILLTCECLLLTLLSRANGIIGRRDVVVA